MLTTLLATCDPCGYVDDGQTPFKYNAIAGEMLKLFRRRRYSPVDLILAFPGEADAGRAMQFTAAAIDWWDRQQDAMWRNRGGVTSRRLA